MPNNEGQEKTEQPTPKKLTDSREKGQVAKSQEITNFAIFTGGLFTLYFSKGFIASRLADGTKQILGSLDSLQLNINIIQLYFLKGFGFFAITISPVLLGIMIVALIANISQVGVKFSVKAIKPKMSKFNILKGIKRIFFSSRSLVEVSKSLAKLAIIGLFTYLVLEAFFLQSIALVDYSILAIVEFMIDTAVSLLWKLALVFAVIGVLDFIFQKYKHKKDLMMSKQEVKDENKQMEGDPEVKSKIKSIQFETARRRMMQDIPNADVVITNPTHYAIALRYDLTKDGAPKVLAKGVDELAQRIKKIAAENGVLLHEDKNLARTLYKMCNVGDEIPGDLFQAVAQILAHIFNLRNDKKSIV